MWPVAKRMPGISYSEIVPIDENLYIRVYLSHLNMHNRILLFYSNFLSLPWEPCTARLFKKIVREAKHIVIAGANIGYYVLIAAQNSKANIHAFEPVPDIRKKCLENLTLNGFKVSIRQEGLAEKEGVAALVISVGDSSLINVMQKNGEHISIPTISLDKYFLENGFQPDLMLLDVEGFEYMIFQGSKHVLAASRCDLIFEINFKELRRANISAYEIFNMLATFGYSIFMISDDYSHQKLYSTDLTPKLVLFSESYCKRLKYEFINCLATKDVDRFERYITKIGL
jgi:FkbM family methyltransferase